MLLAALSVLVACSSVAGSDASDEAPSSRAPDTSTPDVSAPAAETTPTVDSSAHAFNGVVCVGNFGGEGPDPCPESLQRNVTVDILQCVGDPANDEYHLQVAATNNSSAALRVLASFVVNRTDTYTEGNGHADLAFPEDYIDGQLLMPGERSEISHTIQDPGVTQTGVPVCEVTQVYWQS